MNSENDNNSPEQQTQREIKEPDRSLSQATQGDLAISCTGNRCFRGRELIRP
jgi:hypothetical protein